MSLASMSIHRPVLAIVMSIVIIIFGFIGFTSLGVREYPSVDQPIVTVSTNYTGANADVIETQITEPLEEAISGIAGIRSIKSVSREQRSTITVEFDLEIDLETAANDVRDKVSGAMRSLPPDADPPTVSKADADAVPIVFLNVRSEKRDLLGLTDVANNTFKERFQTIAGVSEVRIWGEKKYSMRLWLDPTRLAGYGLTALDIQAALDKENVELPSGRIEGATTELTVKTVGRINDVEGFNNLIIRETDGNIVRLRDVGYAELAPENLRSILRKDNIPMVGVVLIPQPGSNYITIVDEFYNRLEQIKKDLPGDIELGIGFDTTRYIRQSIFEVVETIFIAFVLVVLIIFFFLRNWRSTLIPVLAIPISLIGVFFVMYVMGFSINVLTLLGIVLAIGLVVDDAIVVLENIYAKIEEGMTPMQAAFKGSREVYFAVISTTIALAAVFLPVIFLEGITGRLFREFGIVVAGSVIISAFVALSLTPMLCARILKPHTGHGWFYRLTEPLFEAMNRGYKKSLELFMRQGWLAFVIIAATIVMMVLIWQVIPTELAPTEDRSNIRVNATAPEGTTYEYMDDFMLRLSDLVNETVPENDGIITVTSPGFGASSSVNSGSVTLVLKDPDQRLRTQSEINKELNRSLGDLSEARAFATESKSIGSNRGGLPVQYVIQAPDFNRLKEKLPTFLEEARKSPLFNVVDIDLKFNKPEVELTINRDKAQALGVSVVDIARTLQAALSGQRFGYFIMGGKQYQIIGQVARENRNKPIDIRTLYVRSSNGGLVQLDNIITLTELSNPPTLYRFNRYVSATVSAGLAGNTTLGDGIKEMDAIAKRVLDESFSTSLDGESRDLQESSSSLLFAFILAITLIFLVLAAQFESFRDPFIILITVPLAIGGALLSLWLFNHTLNIFSEIGMIMLIGLITKNGILIVEFANQRKAEGLSRREAVIDAATSRFRPILMTSLATILGIAPIALALGAGAESRIPMGIAVIGGLIFSGVLTLYIIPVMYSYFSNSKPPKDMSEIEKQSYENPETVEPVVH